jgi:hypothetical protein
MVEEKQIKKMFVGIDECIDIIFEIFNNPRISIESIIDSDGLDYIEITIYPTKYSGQISMKEFKVKVLNIYSILREKGYRDICEKVVIRKGWSSYEDKISL